MTAHIAPKEKVHLLIELDEIISYLEERLFDNWAFYTALPLRFDDAIHQGISLISAT